MAINILNKKKDENGNDLPADQQDNSSPNANQTGVGSVFSGGNSTGPTNANQTKGSGFTNIQRIAGANQPAQLGQAIGQGIKTIAQNTQQQLGQAQNQFQTQAQQNRLGTAQDVANRQSIVDRVSQGGADVAPTDQELSVFDKYRAGQYSGPQGLQDSDTIQRQAQQAEQLAQATRSTGGRQSLLQRFVGTPQYTQGQQRLDNLLLGIASPQQLTQARRSAVGLVNNVEGQQQAAQSMAQYLSQQAQDFGSGTADLLGNKTGEIQGNAENLLKSTVSDEVARQTAYDQAKRDLASGQISQDDAMRLGGQELVDFVNSGERLYGTSPLALAQKFLATNNPDALPTDISQVINKENAARYNALNRLSGQENKFDLNNVNTFKASTQAFDLAKLKDQIAKDKEAAEKDYQKRLAASRMQNPLQADAIQYLKDASFLGAKVPLDARTLASTISNSSGGGEAENRQYADFRNTFANKIQPELDRVDANAPNEYAADPSIRSQFPTLNEYINQRKLEVAGGMINSLNSGISGVTGSYINRDLRNLNLDSVRQPYGNLSDPATLEKEQERLRGATLKFKPDSTS